MSSSNMSFVYPRNVRFHCARCTSCCGNTQTRTRHIIILRKEAKTISETTSKSIKTFAHQIEGREPYVYEMRKREDGKCVFLEGDACVIYASRPVICRYYPFELKSQVSGKCEFSFTTECPGLASGDVLRESYFRALFRIACERLG
jgi:Fe-S-cluster containining protein